MTHGVAARAGREQAPLLGRADELESLERLLDELERGPPAAIELVGEPGIGKTRLLGELASRAELRGHLVLSGSASELEHELPFSVFVHALDEFVESLDGNQFSMLEEDVRAELAHVFPSLSALADGRAVALQHEVDLQRAVLGRTIEDHVGGAPPALLEPAQMDLPQARPPVAHVFRAEQHGLLSEIPERLHEKAGIDPRMRFAISPLPERSDAHVVAGGRGG